MNNAKAFLCLNKKLPIILSYRGALHGQIYRRTRKYPACWKVDALKYTERVGKPCKYMFYQLPVPSKCFLDCDYTAMRTALAVCLVRKVIL